MQMGVGLPLPSSEPARHKSEGYDPFPQETEYERKWREFQANYPKSEELTPVAQEM